MSETEMSFLTAIRANPADDLPRLVYADWLDDHGCLDKAEYLRAVCEIRRLQARLTELQGELSAGWTSEISPWCRVVLVRIHPTRKIGTIKLIREVTRFGLAEVKGLVESTPSVIVSRIMFEDALAIAERFRSEVLAEVAVQAVP